MFWGVQRAMYRKTSQKKTENKRWKSWKKYFLNKFQTASKFIHANLRFYYWIDYLCGMEKFEVHILGCGSALPTLRHWPSSQIINLREKLFMIDCGEGTQVQFRRSRQKFSRLSHIFISHLHGDHIFGLIGLLSTLALSGRTAPMHIYAAAELEGLLRPQLDFFCKGITFDVEFHPLPRRADEPQLIYDDRSVSVYALSLRHRVPTCGFIFREKALLPHIRRDMIDFLKIPFYAINSIKQGEGWTTPDGDFYPHERLVFPAEPARTYAYFSDTSFMPQYAPFIQGIDLLYHEATFSREFMARARETQHSTAAEAAEMARLAQVKQLVIGHFSSRYEDEQVLLDEASAIFANTTLAKEGRCIQL